MHTPETSRAAPRPQPTPSAPAKRSRAAASKPKSAPAASPRIRRADDDGVPSAIALNLLFRDPLNVRKTGGHDVAALAALIAEHSLLQNLIVRAEIKGRRDTGRRGVVAGGRRLAALQLLAEQGCIAPDAPVPCKLVTQERAVAVSLAENCGREDLHGADLFDAFLALHAGGRTAEQIASAWGVSVLTVQRRLKLAAMAPELIELYRRSDIDLAQLEALALLDDPRQQLATWNGLPPHQRDAYTIRRVIRREGFALTHRFLRFIGVEAFTAAGGRVLRDLFSEDGAAGTTEDTALALQLAVDALQAYTAANVNPSAFAWVETRIDWHPNELYRSGAEFRSCPTVRRRATAAESSRLRAYARLLPWLQDKADASDDSDAAEPYCNAIERREVEQAGLYSTLQVPAIPAGCIVYLDTNGSPRVQTGLALAADLRTGSVAAPGAAPSGRAAASPPAAAPMFSERVMRHLTAHRTAAMQARATEQPRVALRLLAFHMASASLLPYGARPGPLNVRLTEAALEKHAPDVHQSRAGGVVAAARARWGDMLPGDHAALLQWALGADDAAIDALLAYCTALTLDAVRAAGPADPVVDAMAAALGVDMADWWQPTVEGFFLQVPKRVTLDAARQSRGPELAARLAAMKKRELAAAVAAELQGSRWLPTPLRPAA